MIDAVLTYHTNPATCGTAKWNLRLAEELGVPCYALDSAPARTVRHPLVSIRWHEYPFYALRPTWESFDLFLHEWVGGAAAERWFATHYPTRLYAGNAAILAAVRPLRPDVIEAWCPPTIRGNPTRGAVNVLTFGMAHKIQTERYVQLKTLLDATGCDYTVSVSTAIHEGSPWDEVGRAGESLRAVYGLRLRVLGYLADDALARELQDCAAVALFFDPALRANNTTAWAVLDADKPLITNRDDYSPRIGLELDHLTPDVLRRLLSGAPSVTVSPDVKGWRELTQLVEAG